MESKLYPLKFTPIYKDKIWGGNKIKTVLNKDYGNLPNCGESWEISGVEGDESVVSNGFLAENTLNELVEVYMDDLVGLKVYKRFGNEFPLLIKFIDAMDDLSIQVHPDDKLSKERHNAYGKTEMWYVLQADPGASLISGFAKEVSKQEYLESVSNNTLTELLNADEVKAGDVFFIPAGRVHAIGKGIVVAEIQQTSDVTYRIFDFNRKDSAGNPRELHTELAVDAIDFKTEESYKTAYELKMNLPVKLVDCPYFTTNILEFNAIQNIDIESLDSFVIYICIEGGFNIVTEGIETVSVAKGESVLIPASLGYFQLVPEATSKVLEVYLKNSSI